MAAKYSTMALSRRPPLAARCIVLLLAVLLAAPALHAQTDLLGEAGRLLGQGRLEAALDKTEQALKLRPKDAQARFLKGRILTEMQRDEEAIGVFSRLNGDYPELPEPYNNLAVLYARQGRFEQARNALEMAVRANQAYATAHENLGDLYARLAGQSYGRALQYDAGNAGLKAKLALAQELVRATPHAAAARPAPAVREDDAAAAGRPGETPAPQAAADEREVESALRDWAAAWSRKDAEAYLAAYADDFRTPGGIPRKAWEAERRRSLAKAEPIAIDIEDLRMAIEGERATARFRQRYQSGSLKTAAGKTMVLVRRGDKWLIQQERVSN